MPSHRARAAAALWIACAITAAACTPHDSTTDDDDPSSATGEAAHKDSGLADSAVDDDAPELDDEATEADPSPRGFGALEARVPGTDGVVGGLRIAKHRARVRIRDGFAWTELEEDVQSSDARVLESNYAFALPSDATVARLALWVGDELVEGEIVERARARRIFRGIVDDTVRPRDPALLEWVRGSEVSLSIFPIPSRGTRTVRLAYTQPLAWDGDRVRYVMPLSLGADRAASLDDFSLSIEVDEPLGLDDPQVAGIDASLTTSPTRLELDAHEAWWTPTRDLVVSYRPARRPTAMLVSYAPSGPKPAPSHNKTADSHPAYAAIRVRVEPPKGVPIAEQRGLARVVVIDTSQSQSKETLAAQVRVASTLVEALDHDERFAVLACDSACASYPATGLAEPTRETATQLAAFLDTLEPAGASDLGGAIAHAATRLRAHDHPQLVVLADGSATAGTLHAEAIGLEARAALAPTTDVRLFGAGRTVDTPTLTAIASAIGASYAPLASAGSLSVRARALAAELRISIVRGIHISLGEAFDRVVPAALPSARVGDVITVHARYAPDRGPGKVQLAGSLQGSHYVVDAPLESTPTSSESTAIARGWAEATIARLEAAESPDTNAIVALAREHHVLSRHTALLVLENDAMFRAFGIERLAAHNAVLRDELRTRRGLEETAPLPGTNPPSSALGGGLGGGGGFGVGPRAALGGSVGSGSGASSLAAGSSRSLSDLGLGLHSSTPSGAIGPLGSAAEAPRAAAGDKVPSVRASAATVSGRLPPEVVRRVVRQRTGRLRQCYEQELRRRPNAEGTVRAAFRIAESGAIEQVVTTGMSSDLNACVARALAGLRFPEPEGGLVRVTYPMRFVLADSTAATSAPRREVSGSPGIWAVGPIATHSAEPALAAAPNDHAIDQLVAALEAAPMSRPRHEALIRGLFVRGRFDDALDRATRFVEADTDDPRARELYAFALAATGQASDAARAMGSLVEVDPRNAKAQLRAARAYEAAGDFTRACAHFTAARAIAPSDESAFEALRCEVVRTGDREAVLAKARGVEAPKRHVRALIDALAKGAEPPASTAREGALTATVTCTSSSRCPWAVVITPNGSVIAPSAPAAEAASVSATSLGITKSGAYHTLLVGGDFGARGTVELRAFGARKSLAFEHSRRTTPLARTTISL